MTCANAWAAFSKKSRAWNTWCPDCSCLSRLDAGETQGDWVDVDLAELALSTAEQMRLMAEDRDVEIDLSALKSAVVRGDRARLKQIIVNLLDNAIRFTPRGRTQWLCAPPRTTAAASSRYRIPALAFQPPRFRTYLIDSFALMRLARAKTEARDSDYRLSSPFVRLMARKSRWRAVRGTAAPFASDFPGVQLSRPPWMSRIQRIPPHRVPWTRLVARLETAIPATAAGPAPQGKR